MSPIASTSQTSFFRAPGVGLRVIGWYLHLVSRRSERAPSLALPMSRYGTRLELDRFALDPRATELRSIGKPVEPPSGDRAFAISRAMRPDCG